MKKIYILLLFVFFAGMGMKAQSLSFSQVLLISNVEDTVPAGKVWKIESLVTSSFYHYTGGTSCGSGSDAMQVYIDGNSRFMMAGSPGTGQTTIFQAPMSFPFWLPAGTRLRTACSTSQLSVIEFNVIP